VGNEASKTKALWGDFERRIISGNGIDIGCGGDPITDKARRFDVEDGDANDITSFVHDHFDFVFSCHSLEHMRDPEHALREWWKLVKPGGHLIVVVPDEDLYEQGYFPSLFNDDHKATFTLSKERSWSPKSYNVLELAESLDGGSVVKVELQDKSYDRSLLYHSVYARATGFRLMRLVKRVSRLTCIVGLTRRVLSRLFHVPFDQTAGEAMAQIEFIVRKN
jgi:SAM-dependent methyltransferase